MKSVMDFQTILNQYNLLPNCHGDQMAVTARLMGTENLRELI